MGRKRKRRPDVAEVFTTTAFKQLQREWYRKVEATGHVDLELFRADDDTLMRRNQSTDRVALERSGLNHGADYTDVLNALLNTATFSSLAARIVTGLYAQGMSQVDIVRGLPCRTAGQIHRAIEQVRIAATRYVRKGARDDGEETDIAGGQAPSE